MNKAIKAFVARPSLDPQERIAQRAVSVFYKLCGLNRNAYVRGDAIGEAATLAAVNQALNAFAAINLAKRYPFADEVDMSISDMCDTLREVGLQAISDPEVLVSNAEITFDLFKDELTPVSEIFGVSSVVILRGYHAQAAIDNAVIANDH